MKKVISILLAICLVTSLFFQTFVQAEIGTVLWKNAGGYFDCYGGKLSRSVVDGSTCGSIENKVQKFTFTNATSFYNGGPAAGGQPNGGILPAVLTDKIDSTALTFSMKTPKDGMRFSLWFCDDNTYGRLYTNFEVAAKDTWTNFTVPLSDMIKPNSNTLQTLQYILINPWEGSEKGTQAVNGDVFYLGEVKIYMDERLKGRQDPQTTNKLVNILMPDLQGSVVWQNKCEDGLVYVENSPITATVIPLGEESVSETETYNIVVNDAEKLSKDTFIYFKDKSIVDLNINKYLYTGYVEFYVKSPYADGKFSVALHNNDKNEMAIANFTIITPAIWQHIKLPLSQFLLKATQNFDYNDITQVSIYQTGKVGILKNGDVLNITGIKIISNEPYQKPKAIWQNTTVRRVEPFHVIETNIAVQKDDVNLPFSKVHEITMKEADYYYGQYKQGIFIYDDYAKKVDITPYIDTGYIEIYLKAPKPNMQFELHFGSEAWLGFVIKSITIANANVWQKFEIPISELLKNKTNGFDLKKFEFLSIRPNPDTKETDDNALKNGDKLYVAGLKMLTYKEGKPIFQTNLQNKIIGVDNSLSQQTVAVEGNYEFDTAREFTISNLTEFESNMVLNFNAISDNSVDISEIIKSGVFQFFVNPSKENTKFVVGIEDANGQKIEKSLNIFDKNSFSEFKISLKEFFPEGQSPSKLNNNFDAKKLKRIYLKPQSNSGFSTNDSFQIAKMAIYDNPILKIEPPDFKEDLGLDFISPYLSDAILIFQHKGKEKINDNGFFNILEYDVKQDERFEEGYSLKLKNKNFYSKSSNYVEFYGENNTFDISEFLDTATLSVWIKVPIENYKLCLGLKDQNGNVALKDVNVPIANRWYELQVRIPHIVKPGFDRNNVKSVVISPSKFQFESERLNINQQIDVAGVRVYSDTPPRLGNKDALNTDFAIPQTYNEIFASENLLELMKIDVNQNFYGLGENAWEFDISNDLNDGFDVTIPLPDRLFLDEYIKNGYLSFDIMSDRFTRILVQLSDGVNNYEKEINVSKQENEARIFFFDVLKAGVNVSNLQQIKFVRSGYLSSPNKIIFSKMKVFSDLSSQYSTENVENSDNNIVEIPKTDNSINLFTYILLILISFALIVKYRKKSIRKT